MSKRNKIYWSLGVTEKGTRALLTDENSKFKWLRSQRNRRVLVVLYALGILIVSLGSYYPTLKTNLNLLSGGMATLPTYIYRFVALGFDTSIARAWGAALVLMILVGILFGLARYVSRPKSLKKKKVKR